MQNTNTAPHKAAAVLTEPAPIINQTLRDLLAAQPPGATALARQPADAEMPHPSPFPLAFAELAAPAVGGKNRKPRNGKIAHLPRLEREMVNQMLANNLPHAQIVDALSESGFIVTVRNISNWKTRGGYKEWRAAQERSLELRTFQDNLSTFLRRHDATELPEVGLQSAATTLSALLLRPGLANDMEANPEKYSRLLDLQCRLTREIRALQQARDEAAKAFGAKYNPERIRREAEQSIETTREVYSSKLGNRPSDPNTPHRNFIPKELEPIAELHQTFPGLFQQIKQSLAAPAQALVSKPAGAPTPKPGTPGSQPAPSPIPKSADPAKSTSAAP